MLKIYGRANSINVRKVLWIADELGIPYEREDWGRDYRPLDEPAFKAVNPMAAIPAIDDDGFILRESNVIVRYLAEKHRRTDLFPLETRTRYQIEAWMDWAGSDLYWGVRPVFMGTFIKAGPFQDATLIDIGAKDWIFRMRLLDDYLAKQGPYLMGDTFTVADIPTGLVVHRWFALSFDKPQLDAVARYYEQLSERPAYLLHGRNGTP